MTALPPGQRRIQGFPRFGTHLHLPPPAVPAAPTITVDGAVADPVRLQLADLRSLPRCELTADFHCVSGWSATGLRWEGIPFAAFYRAVIEPSLQAGAALTHVTFEGLDGYRSIVTIEDALGDDVMLAEHLDGRPLDTDHGAPVRLVSPGQYGFISVKHLCRITLYTVEPRRRYGAPSRLSEIGLRTLASPHRRARVWQQERHRYLPAGVIGPVYRLAIGPIRLISRHGHVRR